MNLSRLLGFNAMYTATCGLILLAGAGALTGPFGLTQPIELQVVGGFLLIVAVQMGVAAKVLPRTRVPAMLLTGGDVGYVAASVAAVMIVPMTGLGQAVTLGVAAIVAVFVVLQGQALQK